MVKILTMRLLHVYIPLELRSKSNIFDGHYVHVHVSVLSAREHFPQRSTVENERLKICEGKRVN